MAQVETPEQAAAAAEAGMNGGDVSRDAEADTQASEPVAPGDRDRRKLAMIAGAAVAGAVGVVLLSARSSTSGPLAHESEIVSLRVRPRKVAWRYLASLGLWEASRRRTAFTVTDRRVVVESGLLNREAHAIPLRAVRDVVVRTGRWQGFVNVRSLPGAPDVLIGPLRTPVARRLGSAIARAADDAR
jgi:hypothetical protein